MEFGRRGADQGKEDPFVILARIDERLANHIESFKTHEKDFRDHKDEDKKNFAVLNRAFWGFLGAALVLQVMLGIILK